MKFFHFTKDSTECYVNLENINTIKTYTVHGSYYIEFWHDDNNFIHVEYFHKEDFDKAMAKLNFLMALQ